MFFRLKLKSAKLLYSLLAFIFLLCGCSFDNQGTTAKYLYNKAVIANVGQVEIGIDDYFSKPVKSETLFEKIALQLSRKVN